MDARTKLEQKMAAADRQIRIGHRSTWLFIQGMLVWAVMALSPALFIDAAYTLPGVTAAFFAAAPLVAWYSWRLARAEYR